MIAKSACAGQFVRVLAWPVWRTGAPLTLADWDEKEGTICLVVQGMEDHQSRHQQDDHRRILHRHRRPLDLPSEIHHYDPKKQTVVFAGGVGLPPVYPIAREHLRQGNHVTLISGFRSSTCCSGSARTSASASSRQNSATSSTSSTAATTATSSLHGFVTTPLEEMLKNGKKSKGRDIAEVVTIGPPLMMRAVSDLTKPYGVKTVASLNSIKFSAFPAKKIWTCWSHCEIRRSSLY